MDILIREAKIYDAKHISTLSFSLGYETSEEDTLRYLQLVINDINNVVYVATFDNSIIGWVHVFYTVRIESGAFCEIAGLVVDDAHRGYGIGGKLVDQSRLWAAEKKSSKLRVRSNIIREDAKMFYLKQGFKHTKSQNIFDLKL